jgi:hypothetical protein
MRIKKYASVFCFVCIAAIVQAQPNVNDIAATLQHLRTNTLDNCIPYRKGDLWGFCDSTKKILVPPVYYHVTIINTCLLEGTDPTLNHQDIYTTSGKKLNSLTYRGDFKNGYAIISMNSKSGLMDTTGRLVISAKYNLVRDCREGMAICSNEPGESIVVDSTGREVANVKGIVSAFYNGRAFVDAGGKHGSIDKNGNITWFQLDYMFPTPAIEHGFIRIISKESHGNGLLNMNGKVIVPADHASIQFYDNRLIIVRIREKYGLYDTSGKVLLPVEYDKISAVGFDLHLKPEKRHQRTYFELEKNGLHGMIDSVGTFILLVEYFDVSPVTEDIFYASKNGMSGHFHLSGRVITPMIYQQAGPFIDGISWVKVNNKFRLVNEKGWFINEQFYDGIESNPRIFGDSVILMVQNKRIVVVDHEGKIRVPPVYTRIFHYDPQRLRVQEDSLYGMVDLYGHIIIPIRYSWLGFFSEGYAWAFRQGKYVIVDLTGHETAVPEGSSIERGSTYFKNGISPATIGGKMMYVNTNGQVQQKYEKLQSREGWFVAETNGKYGVLDEHGQLIVQVKYSAILYRVTNRLYLIMQNGQPGYVSVNGNEYFED